MSGDDSTGLTEVVNAPVDKVVEALTSFETFDILAGPAHAIPEVIPVVQRLARLVHAGQGERVVALVSGEEVPRLLRGVVAAAREDRGGDRRQAQVARKRIRGGDGVGRAGPA